MKNFIAKGAIAAWKDPVISKIIAAALIAAALWLWKKLSSASFSKTWEFIASPTVVPAWLLVLLVAGTAVGLWHFRPRRKPKSADAPAKPLIHDISDASSLIAAWWPKSIGYFPDDVHVDYSALENQFSLAPGVAKQAVSVVASQNYFRAKIPGDRYATFEYDYNKAHGG